MSELVEGSAGELPAEIDTSVPSVARAYDYALGGKDHFEVDRAAVRAAELVAPEAGILARDNRAWLIRATRFLAGEAGIGQFLDIGSGLPAAENTHQVVQRINREARVVYVDNDPAVVAHGRALLEENKLTRFVPADLNRPDDVLENEVVRGHLDWSQPMALYQVATLHHQSDGAGLAQLMRTYIDALPSGSYVALSHFYDPGGADGEMVRGVHQTMLDHGLDAAYFRSRADIESFLPGLELVTPGLVPPQEWWPDGPRFAELTPVQRCMLVTVGRKP